MSGLFTTLLRRLRSAGRAAAGGAALAASRAATVREYQGKHENAYRKEQFLHSASRASLIV